MLAMREMQGGDMSSEKTKGQTASMVAIMALYFLCPMPGAANGAMSDIQAAFPDAGTGVTCVTTIVALT
jgi:hypothetical protein